MRIGRGQEAVVERVERGRSTNLVRKQANYMAGESTMKASAIMEPIFRDYVLTRVLKQGMVRWDALCDSGAEVCGCHATKTAPHYLRKMVSDEGLLLVTEVSGEKWVTLRTPVEGRRKAAGPSRAKKAAPEPVKTEGNGHGETAGLENTEKLEVK